MWQIKRLVNTMSRYFNSPKVITTLRAVAVLSLVGLVTQAFADAGTDLLSGTEASLLATLKGTGKKYIYITEGIVALIAYITTRNFMVLIGIIVVAIFFNVMLTIAGA
jgi:hypothetical protein